MTKIGAAPGGIQPPISDFDSNKPTKLATTEAPEQKTATTAADTANASDAKGVMNSTAELMKKKLQDVLNPSQLQSGEAPASKLPSSPHAHTPVHPSGNAPTDTPHPSIKLNSNDGGSPQVLINEKPAARYTEEKK